MASLNHRPKLLSPSASGNENTSEINVALEMELEPENRGAGVATELVRAQPTGTAPRNYKHGVYLTWKDLWVRVPNGSRGSMPILQGLYGYAQPGELLAIMGPSGGGKSTLLDSLAGRLSENCIQTGEILINGRNQEFDYRTSAYVTDDDTLVATLTVKEAVYYSAELQLPGNMSNSEKKERAEMTIREMGLQDAMNTRIGGWGCKGISRGQKRRVSICIEILTRPKLLFLDEPTSGLDSAMSQQVMQSIASLAQNDEFRMTIVTSIHQPSKELFQLFNNLCLMSSGGKMVYFGPASSAIEFFAASGFPCSLQNPSDHLLKTISKDFEKDLEQGFSGDASATSTEEVVNTLIKEYKVSHYYQQVQAMISEICKQDFGAPESKRTHATFLTHCQVLTRRSFLNMYRNPAYYWFRLACNAVTASGLASVFYNLGLSYSSIQARGSLIMFVSTFLPIMALGGFPSFVEEMKVFERERLNGHYSATAFMISNTLSAMPFLLLIVLVPGPIVYFLTGLQRGTEHFVYFAAILFVSMLLIESMMMAVASVVAPNLLMGIVVALGILSLMSLSGGFFRLPNDIPAPFWKYPLYYISYFRYVYQGLFKNEFAGLTFSNHMDQGNKTTGEEILRETWQVEMEYSKWVDLAILLGMAACYRLLFLMIIKISEAIKPVIARFRAVKHASKVYRS